MITNLQEAVKIALDAYGGFDEYAELDKAYVFSKHRDDDVVQYGGMDAPLVVSKVDGKVMPYHVAAYEGLLGDGLKDGDLKSIPAFA